MAFWVAAFHPHRWHERNVSGLYELPRRFEEAGLVHDRGASTKITRWAYQQVARQGGQVWVEGTTLVRLGEEWEAVLGQLTRSDHEPPDHRPGDG